MATTTTMVSRYLPMDIVTNVLLRLPSKSLLRFRCVCTSWRDLISNPKFIQLHRDLKIYGHVFTQSDSIDSTYPIDSTYALHCDKTFVEQTILQFFPLLSLKILGCSNGLVCMSPEDFRVLENFEIYLWNPSIRKFKTLPESLVFPGLKDKTCELIAFGFVPKTNDYRVLKILHGWVDHDDDEDFVVKAEIYSLNANSWKRVENVVHCQVNPYRILSVVNGVVYFKAMDMEDGCYEEIIVSFDMADEVFGKTKIWDVVSISNHHYDRNEIYPVMLGEELFFFWVHYKQSKGKFVVDVWGKNEHAAAESWTKKLTIDHWLVPLGFLQNGEIVWRYRDEVTSYDPRLPEPIDHKFDGNPSTLLALYYYSESLILLNEAN